ncbi:MAG: DAK2 domain-containing protein [Clostridia bacterium]|nr:DAK2 domain-containing protein [Clostridia bacterium]
MVQKNKHSYTQLRTIGGSEFKEMLTGASHYFKSKIEIINALNVFPVPDGDTGTNMGLTLSAAVEGMMSAESGTIAYMADLAAQSSLLGARGNSGVILSQFFRGLSRGLRGKEEAGALELAKAFQYAVVMAYRAVSQPVEGTILTVAREMAKGAKKASRKDPILMELFQVALDSGHKALENTTEQLPALKEAGVVDAGGYGLVVFIEGCLRTMSGEKYESEDHGISMGLPGKEEAVDLKPPGELVFNYCTELIVKGMNMRPQRLKEALTDLGDSLMVVGDSKIIKVHIHTNHPGDVLEQCLKRGSIHRIKIDNMLDQHRQAHRTDDKALPDISHVDSPSPKDVSLISVCNGAGLNKIFEGLGGIVINGGPTMNPRVKDFIDTVQSLEGKAIILPNDKNIRLAAEQAVQMINRDAAVIPTVNIPQGIAAATAYNALSSFEENIENMNTRLDEVKSGFITYAVREGKSRSGSFDKGDIIGLVENRIAASGKRPNEVLLKIVKEMVDPQQDEIVSIIHGEDISPPEAQEIGKKLEGIFPELEIEILEGAQPLYFYYIAVE